jgi:acetyl esterase
VIKKSYILILTALLFISCGQTETPQKYIPGSERKREKYATPEPGTYLRPMAYTLLMGINKAFDEPESYKAPAKWIRNIFVIPQKRLVDTILRSMELSIPVRIYYPSKKSLGGNHPVTLFLHGGGFAYGSVEEYHIMVSKLAKITDQIIVSVDYRLAPEHPFPEGLNDCFAALCWLQDHAASIGADSTRICVMGDSAGGNLATVLTLLCRDNERPQPVSQVLIYPGVTFVDTHFPSREYFVGCKERSYVLTEDFLRSVKAMYMAGETNDRNPYISPSEARLTPDLAPALVITAECDPIRDDGCLYAEKLESSGVKVEHIQYSGMIHGFMSFHMIIREATEAMKYIRDYTNRK